MVVCSGQGGSLANENEKEKGRNVNDDTKISINHPEIFCLLLHYLEKAQELRGEHLRDQRQFAPSDLVPLVAVGGERLRPRGADHRQGQSKDVSLSQVAVVLQRQTQISSSNSLDRQTNKKEAVWRNDEPLEEPHWPGTCCPPPPPGGYLLSLHDQDRLIQRETFQPLVRHHYCVMSRPTNT